MHSEWCYASDSRGIEEVTIVIVLLIKPVVLLLRQAFVVYKWHIIWYLEISLTLPQPMALLHSALCISSRSSTFIFAICRKRLHYDVLHISKLLNFKSILTIWGLLMAYSSSTFCSLHQLPLPFPYTCCLPY